MKFFNLIFDTFNVFSKAGDIKANSDTRSKSVRFAMSSMVYSLIMFACAFTGGLLFSLKDIGFLYIFVAAIAVILFISVIIEFIGALLRVIAQFTINRSAASWISLIVFITAVSASIIALMYFFK